MIKALLCDFDGTIANTLWLYPKAYKNTLSHFGFEKTNEWIYNFCIGKTEEEICKALGMLDRVEEFRTIYFSSVNSFAYKSKLFSGVNEILRLAHEKNIKLGILSFARRWYVDLMINKLDLQHYFDVVIGFEDVVNPKPAPDAVKKACEVLGIMPFDCLVIGDTQSDILMGKNAGAKTVLFHPEENKVIHDLSTLKQSEPDFIINSWRDLNKYI